MSAGLATNPRPAPTMKQVAATSHTVAWTVRSIVSAAPSTAVTLPINAVDRKPARRYTRLDCDAVIGQPSVRAATLNPAMSGPTPITPCANVGTYDVRPMSTAPTPHDTRV